MSELPQTKRNGLNDCRPKKSPRLRDGEYQKPNACKGATAGALNGLRTVSGFMTYWTALRAGAVRTRI